MRFVDQCRVRVRGGDGGNGVVAFRREKFVPFGGPSGGDGGRGGDVVFVGDQGKSTLLDFTRARLIEADRGGHGQGSDCHGRGAKDREVLVPLGTQVFDDATGELIADVTDHEQRLVVARGGKGGRGNIHFATPFDRAPRRAEKGEPGEDREVRLELKVLADVGLLGFPNVGKSTFVAAVSAARPKIADYPFTTLTPKVGVVEVGGGPRGGGSSFVVADIPGLIPGASEGAGLGVQFLRHVERTRVLLHLVTLAPDEGRDPLADYRAIRRELKRFSPDLARRPEIVALSMADLPEVREAYEPLHERFERVGVKLRLVSAATRDGLDELVNDLYAVVRAQPTDDFGSEPAKAKTSLRKPKKKIATKKVTAKKAPAKKAPAKKTAAKKKAPAKKTPAKKTPAKKSPAKKTPARKSPAKKSPAKKSPAKKTAPKRLSRRGGR